MKLAFALIAAPFLSALASAAPAPVREYKRDATTGAVSAADYGKGYGGLGGFGGIGGAFGAEGAGQDSASYGSGYQDDSGTFFEKAGSWDDQSGYNNGQYNNQGYGSVGQVYRRTVGTATAADYGKGYGGLGGFGGFGGAFGAQGGGQNSASYGSGYQDDSGTSFEKAGSWDDQSGYNNGQYNHQGYGSVGQVYKRTVGRASAADYGKGGFGGLGGYGGYGGVGYGGNFGANVNAGVNVDIGVDVNENIGASVGGTYGGNYGGGFFRA